MANDESASFAINLEDGTSGVAESAATALQRLRDQIDGDTKALREMQKAMRNLQGGTSVNVQQFRALKEQIDAKKASIAGAQASYLALGGTFNQTRGRTQNMKSMLEQLTNQARAMPGPVGGVASQFASLRSLLAGGAIALGIVAIAAALTTLAAAAVAATAAMTAYGVAQANARRAELLRLEGITKIRNWWGIAAGSAKDLQMAVDDVTGSVALGRGQVLGYAEQLYRAGLRGQMLKDALQGVSITAATQGEQQAKLFAGWAIGAARAGQSVRRLTDDVKARLGGIAAAQMLDLNVQAQKLRENFGALFQDLKVEGLLRSLAMVTELFSQSTVTGRALRTIVLVVFQPMIKALEFLGPLARRFFQGMVLGAQSLIILFLRLAIALKNTFNLDFVKGIDLSTVALKAGLMAVSLLAGALITLTVVFGLLMVPIAAVAGAFYLLFEAISAVYDLWADTDWTELGKSIVAGIVGGITGGAKWVVDTVSNLAGSAWGAFKRKLGISSPSKEFAKLGIALPQGVVAGVNAGAPRVDAAVTRLVDVPSIPTPTESGSRTSQARGSSRAPISIHIGGIEIRVERGEPEEIGRGLRRELERVFEDLALELGAKLEGA